MRQKLNFRRNMAVIRTHGCTIFLFSNLLAQFQREETQLFVLRVMVGLVILYDHVHPQGAFVKGSNVDVSTDIQLNTIFSRYRLGIVGTFREGHVIKINSCAGSLLLIKNC